jgi:hypothetical protein
MGWLVLDLIYEKCLYIPLIERCAWPDVQLGPFAPVAIKAPRWAHQSNCSVAIHNEIVFISICPHPPRKHGTGSEIPTQICTR